MYVLAVFNSRNSAGLFNRMLQNSHISCSMVSNPNGIGSSCGMSVKFLFKYFKVANFIVMKNKYAGFNGFYKIIENAGRINYVLIS